MRQMSEIWEGLTSAQNAVSRQRGDIYVASAVVFRGLEQDIHISSAFAQIVVPSPGDLPVHAGRAVPVVRALLLQSLVCPAMSEYSP